MSKHNDGSMPTRKDKLVAYQTIVAPIMVPSVAVIWIQGYSLSFSAITAPEEIGAPIDLNLVRMVNNAICKP